MEGLQQFLVFQPLSIGLGLVTTYVVYFFLKRRRGSQSRDILINRSTVGILFSDFWFDGFFVRKITSLVYTLSLFIFYSVSWDVFFKVFFGYQTIQILRFFIVLVGLMGVRIILETVISLIKISENSTTIRDIVLEMNDKSS